ncbi:NAD-dependent epimerase/dehydratase family protein [Spirosoma pollinicola]|uniref:NAD-dependent epimerase/dehydratase family protein n=1 Tax=Spirosoma pollinicola TaxID=2057025 RepID=UPI001F0C726C|nr:NAD-dependent epimerase/dehydratase family protein [Spirosoma pollinicola]
MKVSASDPANAEKYAHLSTLNRAENLMLVTCDVRDVAALESFMQGCAIVVHGGTPFQLAVEDPQRDLLDPIIQGTENFLAIANRTEELKRVVFIASVASYNTSFPMPHPNHPTGQVFSEADTPWFSAEDHPYGQAKFLADQVVRKFIKANPDLSFEITTVSPVFVMGNSLSPRADSTSIGMQYLFKHKIAPNQFVEMLFADDIAFSVVDVHDVAEAVFQAAFRSGLHGKNYLLSSESYRISDLSLMLNQQTPAAEAALVYSSTLATNDLGVAFRPVLETLQQAM